MNNFYYLVVSQKIYRNTSRLKFHLDYVCKNINFQNKAVLDVGGGRGLLSFYAAVKGAKNVECLEPESDGSTDGITGKFDEFKSALSDFLPVVQLPLTLQQFNKMPSDKTFDVVLMHNSINHLNESACINFLKDEASYNAYKNIFTDVYNKMNTGGILIIADCGTKNFLNDLGVRSFFAPSIEWHIHQQPKTWISLLREIGFKNPEVAWKSPNSLGKIGKVLMGNSFVSYLTNSRFKFSMEK